jgi:hypothetical protein
MLLRKAEHEPLLQILCLFPASTLICPRVSSFIGFLDILVKAFGNFGTQHSWNYRTFPEQNESFLDREALSASEKPSSCDLSVCWWRRLSSGHRDLLNLFIH